MNSLWVPLMIFAPLCGAGLLVLLGKGTRESSSTAWTALLAGGISFFAAIGWIATKGWKAATPAISIPWIPEFSIQFEAGGDGITALLALLVSLVFTAVLLSEWKRERGRGGVMGSLLVLQTFLLGAVCSENLFVTVFFWSATALPFFFLVSTWGGERKDAAASRTFLFSAVGNALVFASILLHYFSSDERSFSLAALLGGKEPAYAFSAFGVDVSLTAVSFALFSAGFFLRLPVAPAHAWIPAFSKDAPASAVGAYFGAFFPVSLFLYAKLAYGLFPREFADGGAWVLGIGILNALYGAIGTLGRRSPREIIVRLSLALSGFVLIGICSRAAAGLVGSIVLLVAGGLAFAGLALLAGSAEERGWGGEPNALIARAPVLASLGSVIFAALLLVPGTLGFAGYAVTTFGVYRASPASAWILLFAAVIAAAGVIGLYRKMFFGEKPAEAGFVDARAWEKCALFPVCALLVVFGLYPRPVLGLVREAAERWVSWVH